MGNFKPSRDLSQHDIGSDVGYLKACFQSTLKKLSVDLNLIVGPHRSRCVSMGNVPKLFCHADFSTDHMC